MTMYKFNTVDEALATIGMVDENYGFELEGSTKMEDGTILLIENPLTAFVVINGQAYTTDKWTHPNLKKLVPNDHNEQRWVASANNAVADRKLELRKLSIKQTIVDHINKIRGNKAELDENNNIKINGEFTWGFEIHEDRSNSTYRYYGSKTGKLSIICGDYGNKHRFPERKDGSHNYPVIAFELVQGHRVAIDKKKQYEQLEQNRKVVRELRQQTDGAILWRTQATTDPEKPISVSRTLTFSGTMEEVMAFMSKVNKALE